MRRKGRRRTSGLDGVEADRPAVAPQQAAAFGPGVPGEQGLLPRGSLHNRTEQEHYHPLHNRLGLEKKESDLARAAVLLSHELSKISQVQQSHSYSFEGPAY